MLPIATWVGFTIFIAPTHSDFGSTIKGRDGIKSILMASSRRVLILAGATLLAGFSCWDGYSSAHTTAMGVLNLLGYIFAILTVGELTHHQANDTVSDDEDEDEDVEGG